MVIVTDRIKIMITGNRNEEVTNKIQKSAAHNYLNKNNFTNMSSIYKMSQVPVGINEQYNLLRQPNIW